MPGLRELAEADLSATLEDPAGFGWAIRVTDPTGAFVDLFGQAGDIHFLIDPETGQGVSERTVHASVRIATLAAGGLGIPEERADISAPPWLFEFDNINGVSGKFSVKEARPDRTLGNVTCILQVFSG